MAYLESKILLLQLCLQNQRHAIIHTGVREQEHLLTPSKDDNIGLQGMTNDLVILRLVSLSLRGRYISEVGVSAARFFPSRSKENVKEGDMPQII